MKTIPEMTDTELKARGWDALATIEACQRELAAVNDELARRAPQPKKES